MRLVHVLDVARRHVELDVAVEAAEVVLVLRLHVLDAHVGPLEAFRAELAVVRLAGRVAELQMPFDGELRHVHVAHVARHGVRQKSVLGRHVLLGELLVGQSAAIRVDRICVDC